MATVLLTGGTGMIGKALTGLLVQKGHRVIILTRGKDTAHGAALKDRTQVQGHNDQVLYATWNVRTGVFPAAVLSETDYIVHLAGANVAKGRWTAKRKKEIVRSRTDSSALIVQALRDNPNPVKAVISASGIGWYGPDKDQPFREQDGASDDFLGSTCAQWEASITPVRQLGKRLVILRTGIVLATEGGAFPAFKAPLNAGIAAILGGGKQVISWIHLQDICRLYLNAIENPLLEGPYNAVAPGPVTNKALVMALALRLRGRFFIPVHIPEFVLKVLLGEMSVEVLKSCTADPMKIRQSGFQFIYPTLESVLTELTGKTTKPR